MKIKKVVSGALVLATLAASAVVATAADVIETREEKNRDMTTSYSKISNNQVGDMCYHAGSTAWFDDVYAYTKTRIAPGMEGWATISMDTLNGTHAQQVSYKPIDDSYIVAETGTQNGQDYAKWVVFTGKRREKGAKDFTGFNYRIS